MDETERKLLRAAKRGDPAARRRIVAAKLRLVRAIASRYRGMGVPLDDLVQEGTVGLVEAIDRHDPRRGEFDTFARSVSGARSGTPSPTRPASSDCRSRSSSGAGSSPGSTSA